MSEWKEIEFSKLLEDESISYGIVQPGAHSEINSVPIIRVNNIKNGYIKTDDVLKVAESIEDKYKRTRLNGGELLITVVGSVGECAIVPDNLKGWNVARAVSVAKIKSDFDTRFIKYAFKTDDIIFQMYGNTNDTVQPTLNLASLKALKFQIPTFPEQTAIASVLSSLDNKIDLLNRQNATLEKMAETLYRQWFVEEAKEEWEMGKVSDLIKILSGFAFKSSSFVESGKYRLITIKGVQDGYLELNNADKIEELPDRMPDFCKLQIGDILLSLTGNVGRCCLVDTTDLLLNQRVAKLHPINERDRAYTYFLFRQPQIKQLLEEMGKGTAQSNLSPIETSNMELIIPDKEKLTEFSTIATPWLNKLLFNKKAIQTLSNLRDSLLPKLMSGEVTVEI
jgi:type I restriction enzyme S subunit